MQYEVGDTTQFAFPSPRHFHSHLCCKVLIWNPWLGYLKSLGYRRLPLGLRGVHPVLDDELERCSP